MRKIYEEEYLEGIVKDSINYSDCLRKMGLRAAGGNFLVLKKYIEKYKIDISHFETVTERNRRISKSKLNLEEILVENSTYNRKSLKKRLYDEKLKERECEMCGQGEEWMGKRMSLILDHINGVYNDNRIDNLRIVCPNCNSTLDTHAGRNSRVDKIKYYCECGNEKNKQSKKCMDCHNLSRRKSKRPPYEQLVKEISENGYSSTGRKYGVSDNAIRKWIKNYEKTN